MQNYLPVGHKEFKELYDAIRALPPYSELECQDCNQKTKYPSLKIYQNCSKCGKRYKVRCFSASSETEDLIRIVLDWLMTTQEPIQYLEEIKEYVDGDFTEWDEYFKEDSP